MRGPEVTGRDPLAVCLARGELVRYAYRLGKQQASGMLAITDGGRVDAFVLRRGGVVIAGAGETELARRQVGARLTRLAGGACTARFDGGVAAAPPGAQPRVALAGWARAHLEQQLDGALAEALVRELAGMRLMVRGELAPEPADDADRRMLAAMALPRRLDQIWPLARTPKFRLLALLHVLRQVGALEVEGIVAERSAPVRAADPRKRDAARVLGVADGDDLDTVKRAYRRLARTLHPDLHPAIDDVRRRALERRFAEVTAAYDTLAL